MCSCEYVETPAHPPTYTHIYLHKYLHIYSHIPTCTFVHAHMHTHTSAYISQETGQLCGSGCSPAYDLHAQLLACSCASPHPLTHMHTFQAACLCTHTCLHGMGMAFHTFSQIMHENLCAYKRAHALDMNSQKV